MRDQLAACRATAPICFGEFDEFETVNHFQQFTRLFPNSLPTPQVTRIMIGNPRFDAPLRLFKWNGSQEFAHIATFLLKDTARSAQAGSSAKGHHNP